MTKTSLRTVLESGQFIIAPGVFDMFSAKVADRVGFPALYMTGYGVSGSYLGVADALGVLVSGGSDDHGKRTADGTMRLGAQPVPPEVLEALRERAQALRPR